MNARQATDALILAVFRLNGQLIEAGNRLVADMGLTSALWQVLGALDLSPAPLPVAHIARNMGLTRQSVQRVADLLAEKGLVSFEPNPHHQRAQLVVLTHAGRRLAREALGRQRPWARSLIRGLPTQDIVNAHRIIEQLSRRLTQYAEPNRGLSPKEDSSGQTPRTR